MFTLIPPLSLFLVKPCHSLQNIQSKNLSIFSVLLRVAENGGP